MVHPDNAILFSAKRNHEKTWRKLKCILLSDRSHSVKVTNCMIPTVGHSGKGKITNSKLISNFQTLGKMGERKMELHKMLNEN